ncbi:SDR family NAD(P)-dependent oxidoreductase [Algicella marina]|uniref:SDR family NAD(P)-dependent oxidoreductase n=1 Tax=Algicella marina TaxID=2683284 RepID=A0A6P1T1D6_9RHOB|nr:SDR family NAD(P)-dependent oxidoreductase [Algicella marina]QHQ35453.1 SDR family NAD(P)-dependent oxidoreductase [Algicella marina]
MSVFDQIARPKDGSVWITGASSGIGRAVALRLAQDGWTVYATARSAGKLAELEIEAESRPGRIIALPGDVTDPTRMAICLAEITASGPLAMAILNAGVYTPMRATNFKAETARTMLRVNLEGVANALDPLLRYFIPRGTGVIAVTASVAGYRGLPDAAIYSATKAGLIAMCESLAMDVVDLGIRLSVINPGFVRTEATAVNDFEMPFLMEPKNAADRIVDGLARPGFAITFPRRFSLLLRLIGLLPNRSYIAAIRTMLGWRAKP